MKSESRPGNQPGAKLCGERAGPAENFHLKIGFRRSVGENFEKSKSKPRQEYGAR